MSYRRAIICVLFELFYGCAVAHGQTASEFWPQLNVYSQLAPKWRMLVFAGQQNGEEVGYRQVFVATGIGYQLKRISIVHRENIDPDKEYMFVFGGGYEYLHTFEDGSKKDENRLGLQVTIGRRFLSPVLVRDRSRLELRWNAGSYSTRYRNQLSVDYDIVIHKYKLTPYAAIEGYYDGSKHSWNEEQYTAGLEWPYRNLFMVQTYYLRQHCVSGNPPNTNVAGITLNLYFGTSK